MIRKITLVGFAAFCALAFSALLAPGSQAAETTAYTCVQGGTGFQFSDSACTVPALGPYGHVAIPADESTQLTLAAAGIQVLSAEVFGAELVLTGVGLVCEGCMAQNTGSAGSMKVVGSGGKLKYSGVTVEGTEAECTVKSVPGGVSGVVETVSLKFETNATNHVLISPVSGTTLADFDITGGGCEIAGEYFLEGDMTEETDGAFLKPVQVENTLVLDGLFPAELRGEATMEAGLTGGAHHAVALT